MTTAPALPAMPVQSRVNRQDTISTMLVVIITLVALLLGLLLRNSVEAKTKTFTDPSGVAFNYPDTWIISTASADQGLWRVRDDAAGGFPTTFELRRVAVDATAPLTDVLHLVENDLTGTRSQTLTAFKLFGMSLKETYQSQPGAHARYVFVTSPGTVLQESLPTVVVGDDYLLRKASNVYVFSLQAAEDNRGDALPQFNKFVDTATLP